MIPVNFGLGHLSSDPSFRSRLRQNSLLPNSVLSPLTWPGVTLSRLGMLASPDPDESNKNPEFETPKCGPSLRSKRCCAFG